MSVASVNLPAVPSALSPEGNLRRYLSEIWKFPLLEPQEEFMLAKRWREHGDARAAHKLVTSHLRLRVRGAPLETERAAARRAKCNPRPLEPCPASGRP